MVYFFTNINHSFEYYNLIARRQTFYNLKHSSSYYKHLKDDITHCKNCIDMTQFPLLMLTIELYYNGIVKQTLKNINKIICTIKQSVLYYNFNTTELSYNLYIFSTKKQQNRKLLQCQVEAIVHYMPSLYTAFICDVFFVIFRD